MASQVAGTLAAIENGPVLVTFGTTDLGFTREGVEATIEGEWNPVQVDEYGEGWIDAMRNVEGITVTMRLAEHDIDKLKLLIPGSTKSTSGADVKLAWGKSAGYRASDDALALRLHPIFFVTGASDKSRDLVLHKAIIDSPPTFTYETAEVRVYEVTFRGLIDPARVQGDQLFSIGVETVSLDVTPPTVSSFVPADAATGVAVGASIVVTFSEDMDATAVVDQGNVVLHDDTGATVAIGTPTYDSGTFKLTVTPTSSMAAATKHFFTVTQGHKDVAGNNLAADSTIDFTTA